MKFLIKAWIMLLPMVAFGQNRTFIGVDYNPKYLLYQVGFDNGNALYTQAFQYRSVRGFNLEQELNHIFSLETGFYVNIYGESFRIEGDDGYSTFLGMKAYQVPIRLNARYELIEDRLNIMATAGYIFALNDDFMGIGRGASVSRTGSDSPFNDSTRISFEATYDQETFNLLETGLTINYTTKYALGFSLGASYARGFKRIIDMDAQYWINDEPVQTANVFSNGDYFTINFGMHYAISSLWQN